MKKALITGITGQDGSYLAEFLLSQGYEVHGIIRRSSSFNTQRIDHIYVDPHDPNARLFLHYGDLSDPGALTDIIWNIKPDEIYNLGAQSHVKVSFDMPEFTGNVNGLGTTRILEAIRRSGVKSKIYQASSSEMFGASSPPQNEKTLFYPRSPYAISKVYAFWMNVNYREAYGIFACNGILFNHETITSFMPMFCKRTDEEEFDLKPICEIVKFDQTKKEYQSKKISGIQVWGKNGWVDVTFASAYPHDIENDNKRPRFINSRSGAFMGTSNHVAFMEGGKEKKVEDIKAGDCLETIDLPQPLSVVQSSIFQEEAELMGMIVGDGSITYVKEGKGLHGKFTNSSSEIRKHFSDLWSRVTGGTTVYYPSKSGFNPQKIVGQLILVGGNDWLREIDIYNTDRTKRVPKMILNSSPDIMISFLRGYNLTDGLKENKCTYEFRNFKTNSATLAMGLWYLIERITGQDMNLTLEIKNDGRIFYSLNILSTVDNLLKEQKVKELVAIGASQREICRRTDISRDFIRKIQYGGNACSVHHLRRNPSEIKKIIDLPNYDGWFYDLETSSGEFHCGVGKCHVHNSPRRGETFVTRKVTRATANILSGKQQTLYLGNLNAKRDWGYAPEYVRTMWLMLQQENPDDYVVGTGESHSVREFVEKAFEYAEIEIGWNGNGVDEKGIVKGVESKWKDVVKPGDTIIKVDPRYFRPTEVESLCADITKAKNRLGWEPIVKFSDLVKIMVDYDMLQNNLEPKGEGIMASQKSGYGWTNHEFSFYEGIRKRE